MNDETRHKLIRGWLRLFLGWAQVLLAVAGLSLMLTIGSHPTTWVVAAAATAAAITSRLLYHVQTDPRQKIANDGQIDENKK